MVTYNAPVYSYVALWSLRRTKDVDFTVTVVDNRSRVATRLLLVASCLGGRVDRLVLLDRNTLFAEGCNTAARLAPPEATHLLLLNPDIIVLEAQWLERMLEIDQKGITSLGCVTGNPVTRADGYCLLVDRAVWEEAGGLDERFQWWWAVTRLQSVVLGPATRCRPSRTTAERCDTSVARAGTGGRAPVVWALQRARSSRGSTVAQPSGSSG